MYQFSFQSWKLILQFVSYRLMKLDETILLLVPIWFQVLAVVATNGRYGCIIVVSPMEINKAVS